MSRKELENLRDEWVKRWPDALSVWSRFTKLREPHWCFDREDEKRESLASSFAMIRLEDHAVVISLAQVHEQKLDHLPVEVMAHEIGHHVYCPGDLRDHARLFARIRRGLPAKEKQAGLVSNLYSDLLINDRLQRQAGLDLAAIYRQLGGGDDPLWNLYMRIYEILWSLPNGTLAATPLDRQLDVDASLGARVIRSYARDWLRGAGRFAALLYPYLSDTSTKNVRKALRNWLDAEGEPIDGIPDGLAEIEDDEIDGAIHPGLDPDLNGMDSGNEAGSGRSSGSGDTPPRERYRDPQQYRELLRSLGVKLPDGLITARYYRERALPHIIRFPTRELPQSQEPLAEGLENWDYGEPFEQLDIIESLLINQQLIPGYTTVQRTYGTSAGSLPELEPPDLYIGVDCSGSMSDPSLQMSFPVLAGAIMAISALRAGAKVMVALSGEPGEYASTDGFSSNEDEILRVLTSYLGTGYAFGIHRMVPTIEKLDPKSRPVHFLIITDQDIFSMLDQSDGKQRKGKVSEADNWSVARRAIEKGRAGGTYVLHTDAEYAKAKTQRMKSDGWDVAHVVEWEDIVAFAREFSRRKFTRELTSGRSVHAG